MAKIGQQTYCHIRFTWVEIIDFILMIWAEWIKIGQKNTLSHSVHMARNCSFHSKDIGQMDQNWAKKYTDLNLCSPRSVLILELNESRSMFLLLTFLVHHYNT